jgi:hypothetical protein
VFLQTLFNHTSNTIGFFSLAAMSLVIPMAVNKSDPEMLDIYPNYLLLYTLHHYIAEFNQVRFVRIFFFW